MKKNLIVGLGVALGIALLSTLLLVYPPDKGTNLGGSAGTAGVSRIRSHFATSTFKEKSGGNQYLTSTTSFWIAPNTEAFEPAGGTVESACCVGAYESTSTVQFSIDGASSVMVGYFITSSTTASVINAEIQVSPGDGAWYDYVPTIKNVISSNLAQTDPFVAATTTYWTYTPNLEGVGGTEVSSGTSTPTMFIDLEDITARGMRINVGAAGASSSVYMDIMVE